MAELDKSAESPKTTRRVFISYSHDSLEHQQRVLALANQLRRDGVEAWIDQYKQDPDEGWIHWMRSQVRQASRVLLVFTETYQRRFEGDEADGKGLGATFEGVIVTQALYESGGRNVKFRPVVFSKQDEKFIPDELRRFNHYRVDTLDNYQNLLRWLYEAPRIVVPSVGDRPDLSPQSVPELFASKSSEITANSSVPVPDTQQTLISLEESQKHVGEIPNMSSSTSGQGKKPYFHLRFAWILLFFILLAVALLGFWIYWMTPSEWLSFIPKHQTPIASPTGTQTIVRKPAPRTATTLRISFLVNSADKPAANKVGSLQSNFEAAGFDWQPPKTDVKFSPDVTEIRISGLSDQPLAVYVQDKLKKEYDLNSTIDPSYHPDVGSGYVQVSLAIGALK
jgi:hypothetical protein